MHVDNNTKKVVVDVLNICACVHFLEIFAENSQDLRIIAILRTDNLNILLSHFCFFSNDK
jgi:hypothetical protein